MHSVLHDIYALCTMHNSEKLQIFYNNFQMQNFSEGRTKYYLQYAVHYIHSKNFKVCTSHNSLHSMDVTVYMHFKLCSSKYALHSMFLKVCTSQYALHSMHFTVCTSQYAFHSMHFTVYISQNTFHSKHFIETKIYGTNHIL